MFRYMAPHVYCKQLIHNNIIKRLPRALILTVIALCLFVLISHENKITKYLFAKGKAKKKEAKPILLSILIYHGERFRQAYKFLSVCVVKVFLVSVTQKIRECYTYYLAYLKSYPLCISQKVLSQS